MGAAPFADSVTSIFGFRDASDNYRALATAADGSVNSYQFDLTWDALTDTDTVAPTGYFQWRAMNGKAIGVWGGAPIFTDGATSFEELTGTPPTTAWLVEVWNSRCWMVDTDDPSVLKYSKLGDSTDWTDVTAGTGAGQIIVGYQDGDKIMAIHAWRNVMIIWKRARIFIFRTGVGGVPSPDPDGWDVQIYSNSGGCTSPWSVQEVGDDIFFASNYGIASIQGVQQFGDVKRAVISDNILELATVDRSTTAIYASVVNQLDGEYWIAVPSTAGGDNDIVWVYNYSSGEPRWTCFDGIIAGSAFGLIEDNGQSRVYVGTYAGNVFRYGDDGIYDDDGTAYTKVFEMPPKVFGSRFNEKQFNKVGLAVRIGSDPVTINMTYFFDESEGRSENFRLEFNFDAGAAAQWDVVDATGAYLYATATALNDQEAYRRLIKNPPGNRGQSISLRLTNDEAGVYFVIKEILMQYYGSNVREKIEA